MKININYGISETAFLKYSMKMFNLNKLSGGLEVTFQNLQLRKRRNVKFATKTWAYSEKLLEKKLCSFCRV